MTYSLQSTDSLGKGDHNTLGAVSSARAQRLLKGAIGAGLRQAFDEVLDEPTPDSLLDLLPQSGGLPAQSPRREEP